MIFDLKTNTFMDYSIRGQYFSHIPILPILTPILPILQPAFKPDGAPMQRAGSARTIISSFMFSNLSSLISTLKNCIQTILGFDAPNRERARHSILCRSKRGRTGNSNAKVNIENMCFNAVLLGRQSFFPKTTQSRQSSNTLSLINQTFLTKKNNPINKLVPFPIAMLFLLLMSSCSMKTIKESSIALASSSIGYALGNIAGKESHNLVSYETDKNKSANLGSILGLTVGLLIGHKLIKNSSSPASPNIIDRVESYNESLPSSNMILFYPEDALEGENNNAEQNY